MIPRKWDAMRVRTVKANGGDVQKGVIPCGSTNPADMLENGVPQAQRFLIMQFINNAFFVCISVR